MSRFLIFIFTAVLAGCATQNIGKPIGGADITPLRTKKIAVSYQFVHKRINYSETLYRVFWLEYVNSTQDFGGIWPADKDMSELVAKRLRDQGFQADSIYVVAQPEKIVAEQKSLAAKVLQHEMETKGKTAKPAGSQVILPEKLFEGPPSAPEYFSLADELSGKGFGYLAEFTAVDLQGAAPGYGTVGVFSYPTLRIVDLRTNKVVWVQNVRHWDVAQLGGDLRKLEEDGMRRTKDGMRASMSKLDFLAMWGFPEASK
ncbi:hypothetical protein QTH90_31155 [Variovorax sp. J2P1-59]|uniref:hypothetical protein n=1 Tax=Variovorax flavidus TaxID=3053501 RepID=UPI002578CE4B|nr:hypothetical protein [Variovorax sp. J2P1-59]MDM0078900.1 hypothetical protein [Variovorax sp. J2P1-59]